MCIFVVQGVSGICGGIKIASLASTECGGHSSFLRCFGSHKFLDFRDGCVCWIDGYPTPDGAGPLNQTGVMYHFVGHLTLFQSCVGRMSGRGERLASYRTHHSFVHVINQLLTLQAHMPHFFAESTPSNIQSQSHRDFENVPSPHQFVPVWAEHGVMRGTVFTVPASRWTDSDTLHTPWPPPYQGKTARFLKWSAFVEDGFLVMHQDGKNDVR